MARKPDSLFRLVRDAIVGNPVAKQQERIDRAAQAEAEHQSSAAYHRLLANHYGDRVAGIQAHEDWWAFAEAKQQQSDHLAALAKAKDLAEEAGAKRRAETVKLEALRSGAA